VEKALEAEDMEVGKNAFPPREESELSRSEIDVQLVRDGTRSVPQTPRTGGNYTPRGSTTPRGAGSQTPRRVSFTLDGSVSLPRRMSSQNSESNRGQDGGSAIMPVRRISGSGHNSTASGHVFLAPLSESRGRPIADIQPPPLLESNDEPLMEL
jgi:hypothetical protein